MRYSKRRKAKFSAILMLVLSLSLYSAASLYAATRQEVESALESARKDLRISMATEERIASELKKLKESGNASPDIIEYYELYLSRVQAMVAENLDVVAKMETLYAGYDTRKAPDGPSRSDDTAAMVDPEIPEERVVDAVTELDRRLDSSLADFDEMLLDELDLIFAKSSERMRDLAEEAAAAAQRLRDKGIDIDADAEEESVVSEQGSADGQKSVEPKEGAAETGTEGASQEDKDAGEAVARGKSPEGAEGSDRHPRNRFDPKDDDIVARQLREAAESETDPVLREKLWKEYEQYKTGSSQ